MNDLSIYSGNIFFESLEDFRLDNVRKSLSLIYPRLKSDLNSKISTFTEQFQNQDIYHFYFQHKFSLPGLELLYFSNNNDHEIHAFGIAEKLLPLVKKEFQKDLFGVINSWSKEGKEIYLLNYIDSPRPFSYYHPEHYKNQLYPTALIGF